MSGSNIILDYDIRTSSPKNLRNMVNYFIV
jgi:hypothetical protein